MKKYDNYKDSGIEWIGEIPKHWEMWKISHSFKRIGSGTTPESGNPLYHENGTINWLNTGDLNDGTLNSCSKKITEKALEDYSTLKTFPSGSLVMAMYGATIGKTSIINFDTTTNQACCVFCKGEIIDVKFLQYWFLGNKEHIINLAIGGGQPNISQNILKDVRVSCPSFEEQQLLANYLDHKTTQIDHLIAKKEQFITLLQEERTAVINQAVTKGLDPKVKMKDSGIEWLGEIPEHWDITRLGFLSSKIGDGLHGTPNYVDNSDFKFINGNNIGNGQISIYEHTKCVSEEEYFSNKKELNKNSILMSINGTIGNLAFYKGEKVMLGKSVAYINIIDSKALNFTYKYLESESCKTYIDNQLSGSTIKNLSLYSINKIPIPFPNFDEQKEIVNYIEMKTNEIDTIISNAQQEIELLKEYKIALISEVVTGKVDVRDVVLN